MAQLLDTALIADSNLKEYYKLEDANANKNGNNLTNTGTVTFVAAKYSNGASFGNSWGGTKVLRPGNSLTTDLSGAYSISCWVKELATIAGTSATGMIVDWRSTVGTSRYVEFKYNDNGGTPRIIVDVSGTGMTYTYTIGTSTFKHLVVTCSSGGTVTLYVNGASVATGSRGTSTTAVNNIGIGNNADTDTNTFAGVIDDLGFFNKVLSAAEVSTLFAGFSSATSETVTLTETPSVLRGYGSNTAETVTLTESKTITAPSVLWIKPSKSSTSWTNQNKT